MASTLDRPRLRRGLAAGRNGNQLSEYLLWDDLRITHRAVTVSQDELVCAQLFDGRTTVADLPGRLNTQHGLTSTAEQFLSLIGKLDQALLLDSPAFYEYLRGPVREPSCIGTYEADPAKLRKQLANVFTDPGGPGLPPGPPPKKGSLRALLVPHLDYARGGVTYGHGFRELFEKTSARLFVIIATSHYSSARFTLTRQNFRTPFGDVETDQAYVDRLDKHYGEGLFGDPFAHYPEHSIELEVVLMQFLYEQHRPFRIVPLLCGSFHDAVADQTSPSRKSDISRMVTALQMAEVEAGEEVSYVISGDLAHIGPKFDDPEPVAEPLLSHSKTQDELILDRAARIEPDGYFRVIADESDRRRICGLPPTWTTLAAAKPSRGRLLHYGRYVHPKGFESVSFASMAFDR